MTKNYSVEELKAEINRLEALKEAAWKEVPARDRYFHDDYDAAMGYIDHLNEKINILKDQIMDIERPGWRHPFL